MNRSRPTIHSRAVLNPAGQWNAGSTVYGIDKNGNVLPVSLSSTGIVAYVARNPNARYIQAGYGAFPNAGRDTYPLAPIDNIDAALQKRFTVKERVHLVFAAQFFNVLNHSQFLPGSITDLTTGNYLGEGRNYLIPGNADFGQFSRYFPSNSRAGQIVARITF